MKKWERCPIRFATTASQILAQRVGCAMALSIIAMLEPLFTGSAASYPCLWEWEYRVKETLPAASSFSQQRARLWLTVTDNASWTHHCHFKKNCPGTSSPHAKKRSTDDKHTANGWHVSRWKYIPLYRGVHRKNPLFIAIQICAQLAHTVFLVHGSFHTFRRISYSKLKRTKNTNLKIEEEQWNTIWQYDLINFPNLTAAEKKVCQQFPTMSFWEVE